MTDVAVKKMRLFAALPVPADFAALLSALPRAGLDGGKRTHPRDFHITIRFLGDVEEGSLEDICAALACVRHAPFYVEARGLSLFENRKQSILHVPVISTRKMESLCADVTDALIPLGFDFGARPFVPHITLARLKNPKGTEDYIRRHGSSVATGWEASEFHLMRSAMIDKKSSRYSVLETYMLLSRLSLTTR